MHSGVQLLRIIDIIDGTTVDGPGFRTSIYFSGCRHKCRGCHNPQSWDFEGGRDVSVEELVERVEENDLDVTFSGGDPIYQWEVLTKLAYEIRKRGRNIWCYTGFCFEELACRENLRPLLEKLDVIVDGPFIEKLKNSDLHFRGSSNQRIIDVQHWLKTGEIMLWKR